MTQQIIQQQRSEPFSQRLSRWSHEFDLITNHLLGYIIAFTSLVAFADVLGGGQVLAHVPFLYWLWVLAQGLGVEYQVLVLMKRLPGYWKTNKTMFVVYSVFIVFLCIMSVVIGSVFTEHDQQQRSIETAMNALGISHIGFVYARSALAILLVALIAIDRAIEQQRSQESDLLAQDEQATVYAAITTQMSNLTAQMEGISTATREVAEQRLPWLAERITLVEGQVQMGNTSVDRQIHLVKEEMEAMVCELRTLLEEETSARGSWREHQTPLEPFPSTTVSHTQESEQEMARVCHLQVLRGGQGEQDTESYEQKIREVLALTPNASSRTVATSVGCSPSIANKWMRRIRAERGEPLSPLSDETSA